MHDVLVLHCVGLIEIWFYPKDKEVSALKSCLNINVPKGTRHKAVLSKSFQANRFVLKCAVSSMKPSPPINSLSLGTIFLGNRNNYNVIDMSQQII